jgi:hypothetical protein
MTDIPKEAEERYEAACQRRAEVIETWEQLGKPLTTIGSRNQEVDHPLVKQMNDLDRLCMQLGQVLQKKHAGPSPTGVLSAVGKSPAAKLRSVEAV